MQFNLLILCISADTSEDTGTARLVRNKTRTNIWSEKFKGFNDITERQMDGERERGEREGREKGEWRVREIALQSTGAVS